MWPTFHAWCPGSPQGDILREILVVILVLWLWRSFPVECDIPHLSSCILGCCCTLGNDINRSSKHVTYLYMTFLLLQSQLSPCSGCSSPRGRGHLVLLATLPKLWRFHQSRLMLLLLEPQACTPQTDFDW